MSDKTQAGTEFGPLLLEYTLKALLIAGLSELVLYRLISRLGMHLSKVAREYVVVEYFLRGASSIGFALLNFSAILVFLGLFIFLFSNMREPWTKPLDRIIATLVSALVALTVAYLLFPPVMLGSIAYSTLTALAVWAIVIRYTLLHRSLKARAMIICYGLGVSGWLYYQTATTAYSWLGYTVSPPLIHEINRLGEALLVASTALVFAVYGGFSMRTKNRRQQRRTLWYVGTCATLFVGLLVIDSVLELVDPAAARSVRQSSQGIGWIFQMGMGYTFYLPFAFYVAGLLLWAYAVIKQLTMRRLAGYGLALMFIAGYALQLSHLTLFVVLGLLLITYDARLEARDASGRVALGLDQTAAEPSGVS